MLYERSWLFTLLFGLLTLDAVLRLRDGGASRAVWLLPIAFALWANLHVQFIYGLAQLGLACAAPFADVLLKRPTSGKWADTPNTRAWRQLVALTVLCTAATLVNPYHARLYAVVLKYGSQAVPFQVVHELQSPAFRSYADWAFLILAFAGAAALGRRLPQASLFELLLFTAAAAAGFRARRNTWPLVFVSLALCTAGPPLRQAPQFALSWLRVAVVAAAVALITAVLSRQPGLSESGLTAAVATRFPATAVEHVREAGYKGPLFNNTDWGGYLIWALPDHLVSMDGRVNLHGDERLARHANTMRGLSTLRGAGPDRDPWDKDPDLLKARLVVIPRDSPLTSLLLRDGRFRLVHPDAKGAGQSVAAVFVAAEETAPP
jgi:hypothetical protein